jgi:hypothetical protein
MGQPLPCYRWKLQGRLRGYYRCYRLGGSFPKLSLRESFLRKFYKTTPLSVVPVVGSRYRPTATAAARPLGLTKRDV